MGATARNVDFTNVKEGSGFNRNRIPSGDYAALITKVDDAKAKDGIDQYLFSIKLKDRSSSVFPHYCKLQDNQLWKLRNLLVAAGKTVPKKRAKVDPNVVVGKLIGVTIEDDDYDGKELSQITGVFPASELGDDSSVASIEDDEPDTADVDDDGEDLDDLDNTVGGGGVVADEEDEAEEPEEEPEAEEEAEEPADPYEGLDRTAIKARIKAIQADFRVLKSHTDEDLKAALAQLEAGGSEEPEPEAKPARAARKPKPDVSNVSDDDLDDINIDDL